MAWWTTAALLLPTFAWGQGNPLPRNPQLEWEGPIDYAATGATGLDCQGNGLGASCDATAVSTTLFDVIPEVPGLRIVHADLNWFSASAVEFPTDGEVSLQAPGGDIWNVIKDDDTSEEFQDPLDPLSCAILGGGFCDFVFYSYHANVTELLQGHLDAGDSLNGMWTLSNWSHAGANPNVPMEAALALGSLGVGGWTLLVVYEVPEAPLRRIYYYQGFELSSGANRTMNARGFRAPPDPLVDLTFCVLEGDDGITGDRITINNQPLSDACNPVNNVFNSTVNTGRADGMCQRDVFSVDVDTFTRDDVLEPGATEAEIVFVVPGGGLAAQGEQMFTNWVVVGFDHQPAALTGVKPEKQANPPSGSVVEVGQQIDYVIIVENTGGDFAENVTVTDGVPAGTTYVPGSTVVDALAVADIRGVSRLVDGLNLAEVGLDPIEPRERHVVRFSVTVDDAPDGARITNIASLSADGISAAQSDPVNHAVGVLPDGGFPDPDAGPDAGPDPDMRVAPPSDMDPPAPDEGRCGPNTRLNIRGLCEPIPDMALPDANMCGPEDDQCGPGTILVGGQCQARCGAGLRWDPTCAPCGQCRIEGDPPCEGSGKSDDGCGCSATREDPTGALFLALLLVGLTRRRR